VLTMVSNSQASTEECVAGTLLIIHPVLSRSLGVGNLLLQSDTMRVSSNDRRMVFHTMNRGLIPRTRTMQAEGTAERKFVKPAIMLSKTSGESLPCQGRNSGFDPRWERHVGII
jgi:hypothetical protein